MLLVQLMLVVGLMMVVVVLLGIAVGEGGRLLHVHLHLRLLGGGLGRRTHRDVLLRVHQLLLLLWVVRVVEEGGWSVGLGRGGHGSRLGADRGRGQRRRRGEGRRGELHLVGGEGGEDGEVGVEALVEAREHARYWLRLLVMRIVVAVLKMEMRIVGMGIVEMGRWQVRLGSRSGRRGGRGVGGRGEHRRWGSSWRAVE